MINFPFRTAFAASCRFWVFMFSVLFVSRNFFISLLISSITCCLFINVLFNLHVFVLFYSFVVVVVVVVVVIDIYLIALWSEKMLDMISIFLNLLKFDLWPKMWSILENVPCALEKKVYSSAFGWSVLKISVRSISSTVSFKTSLSLLIFCFEDLSIGVTGVLKSPTIIVLLLISPFLSVSVYLMCWGAPMLCA